MKYLALALLLCALASLSNAACYRKLLEPGMTHCQDVDDHTWHAVGSSWTNSQNMACTCESCCDVYSAPIIPPCDSQTTHCTFSSVGK